MKNNEKGSRVLDNLFNQGGINKLQIRNTCLKARQVMNFSRKCLNRVSGIEIGSEVSFGVREYRLEYDLKYRSTTESTGILVHINDNLLKAFQFILFINTSVIIFSARPVTTPSRLNERLPSD
jgi:hypothetical protein